MPHSPLQTQHSDQRDHPAAKYSLLTRRVGVDMHVRQCPYTGGRPALPMRMRPPEVHPAVTTTYTRYHYGIPLYGDSSVDNVVLTSAVAVCAGGAKPLCESLLCEVLFEDFLVNII